MTANCNSYDKANGLNTASIKPGEFTRTSAGFTLVEVMVASLIFLMFCIFFLSAAIAAMRSQQLSCDYYTAMTIARNRIQRAKTFEHSSLHLMSENQVPVDGNGNISATGTYRRTTSVTAYTNGSLDLYKVTIQVNYISARRSQSETPVEISTLVTEKM